jgi:hypothetical protein
VEADFYVGKKWEYRRENNRKDRPKKDWRESL